MTDPYDKYNPNLRPSTNIARAEGQIAAIAQLMEESLDENDLVSTTMDDAELMVRVLKSRIKTLRNAEEILEKVRRQLNHDD